MKKNQVKIFAFICAVFMVLGLATIFNSNAVSVQATNITPTLSVTKVLVSNNHDKMLLATAIKDKDDVYKVGYTFTNDVQTVVCETSKYYTSITSGNTTLTPSDIFDEVWAGESGVGMVIWEINFDLATTYEFKPYALVGERLNGQLVKPETEIRITPETPTSKTFYTITFDTDGGNAIEPKIALSGTDLNHYTDMVSIKGGYDFVEWQVNDQSINSNTKVTQNTTVKATYSLKDYSEYPVYSVANTNVDVRTAGETVNVALPAQLNGYSKVYSKINGQTVATEVKNNGASVDVSVADIPRGESKLLLFMAKGKQSASAEINLTKADMVIKNASDLTALSTAMVNNETEGKYYVLNNDVDYANGQWSAGWPSTAGNNAKFAGTLDGRGYKISNLNTRRGFVTSTVGESVIKNLIIDSPIVGSADGGAICLNNSGTIENCVILTRITKGEKAVNFAGVAVANHSVGKIKNCVVVISGYDVYDQHKDINAITNTNNGTVSNCYAVSPSSYVKYMYGSSVTEGLYNTNIKFFKNVKSLSNVDGWNEYWSLLGEKLLFGGKEILVLTNNADEYGWLIKGGVCEYEILIPNSASYELNIAANELAYFFNIATGIELPIATNSNYSVSGKYISLGKTTLSDSVIADENTLGRQGFRIVTIDDNIVIKSVEDFGTVWGVYELLTRLFNYDYYVKDVYEIDTGVTNLLLEEYDVTDRPDIEQRAVADSQGYEDRQVAHRFRQIEVYGEFSLPLDNPYHNSFYYVMDGVDANKSPIVPNRFLANSGLQLCYTGHGDDSVVEEMLDRSIYYLSAAINKTPKYARTSDAIFGIQDEYGWCTCHSCQSVIDQYGTKSATMILFMNRLRDKLDDYLEQSGIDRDINLYFFAYMDMEEPPVHKNASGEYVANDPSLVCKDGLGIMFAPIHANFTESIYSEENVETYERLKSLKAITNKLLVWTYACNFMDFLAPFDSFTYMPDLFEAIVDNNGTYLFNQGRMSQGHSSQFDVVRQYLVAKLGWDVDADVDALTDKFFEGYFGKAKVPMRQIYDELRVKMRENYEDLGMNSYVLATNVTDKKYWPESLLNSWMDLIDEAYELAGEDEALRERILRESIFIRYHLIKLYQSNASNVESLKSQLISDAKSVGIVMASAHKTTDQMFS